MADMKEHFDTSSYETDHFLYSNKYKKTPGKFKDELSGKLITEYIGLRPKMYSLTYNVEHRLGNATIVFEKEKNVTKGISRVAKEDQLCHDNFQQCIFNNTPTLHVMQLIRSEQHKLFIQQVVKKGLSNFDDKRFWKGI